MESEQCVCCNKQNIDLISLRNRICNHLFCFDCLINYTKAFPDENIYCFLCNENLNILIEKYIKIYCDNCGIRYYVDHIEDIDKHLCVDCNYI